MTTLKKTLLIVCGLMLISGAAVAQDVLVWATGNGGYGTQGVADYLLGTGQFASTTAMDADFVDLATLNSYDAVLYFSNGSGGQDPVAIGDVLADFADTGARLVICTFSWANQGGNTLEGRVITDEISPFWLEGTSLYTYVAMDWNDGTNFFAGVGAVNGYYHDDVTLTTAAELHATWDDGEPLLASKGNVVGVNLFPDDYFGEISGDYVNLFANALSAGVVATENSSWSQLKASYR